MLAVRRAAVTLSRSVVRSSVVQRGLATSASLRKDFVQDLYLRELKGYKPKEVAANAHVGNVKEFHSPSAPKAPVVPTGADLAKELEAYDAEEPSLGAAKTDASASSSSESEGSDQSADEYLAFVEQEAKRQPAPAHH